MGTAVGIFCDLKKHLCANGYLCCKYTESWTQGLAMACGFLLQKHTQLYALTHRQGCWLMGCFCNWYEITWACLGNFGQSCLAVEPLPTCPVSLVEFGVVKEVRLFLNSKTKGDLNRDEPPILRLNVRCMCTICPVEVFMLTFPILCWRELVIVLVPCKDIAMCGHRISFDTSSFRHELQGSAIACLQTGCLQRHNVLLRTKRVRACLVESEVWSRSDGNDNETNSSCERWVEKEVGEHVSIEA